MQELEPQEQGLHHMVEETVEALLEENETLLLF